MAKPVRWDLIADPIRYKRGFREAEQTNQRFARSMRGVERDTVRFSSRVGKVGPLAVTAFGGAAVAAGGLAAAGAVLGLKTAANLETAEVAFSRLLGSGKRARSFLEELKGFAARTPFELPGLVDAARALVGAGTAAKDVIPILTSLGDASGALGLDQERFGRVMIAVTQIMNRGRVQAEELNQITEAGIPVWTLLAKATGKPIPELQKMMQAGKLLAKDTLPLLFDQMRKDYGGGMAKQAQTLNGIWSTFKDTISITLADALKPLVPVIKTVLPQAAKVFQGAFEGIASFFRDDLGPELGRVRQAWDENKGAILGLAGTLSGTQNQFGQTKDAAASLADVLVAVTQGAGDASRFLNTLGNGLNEVEQGSDRLGSSINDKLRPGWEWFTERTALGMGTMRLYRGILGDVKADLADIGIKLGTTADQTDRAARSSDSHAAALRNQKAALDALNGALKDEESAELDVRQAKLNVQVAQGRLNDLKKAGKTRSVEYAQAQLDLRRAQIQVRDRTREYKDAQLKANAATTGAMRAAQQATRPVRDLGQAAQTGGRRANDAKIPWRQLGSQIDGTFREIHNKTARITAKFGWQGLEVFRVGGGVQGGLKAQAKGGPTSLGRVTLVGEEGPELVRFTSPGHVYTASETQELLGRGMASGGPVGRVPTFSMQGQTGFVKALGDWDLQVDKVLNLAAARFKQRAERSFGGALGGLSGPGGYRWQTAVLRAAFPGLPIISDFRRNAITATGNRSYHALGRAVDVPPRMDVFNWIRGMFGQRTRELIFSPANNRQVWNGRPHYYTGITRRNHWDHVHWAYDKGGWLMPGQTGTNYTNKPERVLGPQEKIPTAREIARELVGAMQTAGLGAVYLDSQRVDRQLATARVWNERRR